MLRTTILITMIAFTIFGCNHSENKSFGLVCSASCKAKSKSGTMSCKLTSAELRNRKETVIASLKSQMIDKKELEDGFAFKFVGSDSMVDELTEFIKTERACCDFFTFTLSISGDKSELWLALTGEHGVKEFISTELGL